MAEVIHTIKGNEYLYVHTREGDKVVCRYVGPVGKGGKVRAAQHGGGAPSEVTQQTDVQTKNNTTNKGKTINKIRDNSRLEQEAQEKSNMDNKINVTVSGKKAKYVGVNLIITGDTFPVKDHLKTRGYIWDGTNWSKETNLLDARDEVKILVLNNILKPDKIEPILVEIKDEDRKDRRKYEKDYIRNLYEKPSETFQVELTKLGYIKYPNIPATSYKFEDGHTVVDKSKVSDIIVVADIFKYEKLHPELNLPKYEGGIEGLRLKEQKYVKSQLEM